MVFPWNEFAGQEMASQRKPHLVAQHDSRLRVEESLIRDCLLGQRSRQPRSCRIHSAIKPNASNLQTRRKLFLPLYRAMVCSSDAAI